MITNSSAVCVGVARCGDKLATPPACTSTPSSSFASSSSAVISVSSRIDAKNSSDSEDNNNNDNYSDSKQISNTAKSINDDDEEEEEEDEDEGDRNDIELYEHSEIDSCKQSESSNYQEEDEEGDEDDTSSCASTPLCSYPLSSKSCTTLPHQIDRNNDLINDQVDLISRFEPISVSNGGNFTSSKFGQTINPHHPHHSHHHSLHYDNEYHHHYHNHRSAKMVRSESNRKISSLSVPPSTVSLATILDVFATNISQTHAWALIFQCLRSFESLIVEYDAECLLAGGSPTLSRSSPSCTSSSSSSPSPSTFEVIKLTKFADLMLEHSGNVSAKTWTAQIEHADEIVAIRNATSINAIAAAIGTLIYQAISYNCSQRKSETERKKDSNCNRRSPILMETDLDDANIVDEDEDEEDTEPDIDPDLEDLFWLLMRSKQDSPTIDEGYADDEEPLGLHLKKSCIPAAVEKCEQRFRNKLSEIELATSNSLDGDKNLLECCPILAALYQPRHRRTTATDTSFGVDLCSSSSIGQATTIPLDADRYYRTVVRLMIDEHAKLKQFLCQLVDSVKPTRSSEDAGAGATWRWRNSIGLSSSSSIEREPPDPERLKIWAHTWIKVMSELRFGVRLKPTNVDEPDPRMGSSSVPTQTTRLAPFNALMEQIRAVRKEDRLRSSSSALHRQRTLASSESLTRPPPLASLRSSGAFSQSISLPFIDYRLSINRDLVRQRLASLKPAADRPIPPAPPVEPSLHERLMHDVHHFSAGQLRHVTPVVKPDIGKLYLREKEDARIAAKRPYRQKSMDALNHHYHYHYHHQQQQSTSQYRRPKSENYLNHLPHQQPQQQHQSPFPAQTSTTFATSTPLRNTFARSQMDFLSFFRRTPANANNTPPQPEPPVREADRDDYECDDPVYSLHSSTTSLDTPICDRHGASRQSQQASSTTPLRPQTFRRFLSLYILRDGNKRKNLSNDDSFQTSFNSDRASPIKAAMFNGASNAITGASGGLISSMALVGGSRRYKGKRANKKTKNCQLQLNDCEANQKFEPTSQFDASDSIAKINYDRGKMKPDSRRECPLHANSFGAPRKSSASSSSSYSINHKIITAPTFSETEYAQNNTSFLHKPLCTCSPQSSLLTSSAPSSPLPFVRSKMNCAKTAANSLSQQQQQQYRQVASSFASSPPLLSGSKSSSSLLSTTFDQHQNHRRSFMLGKKWTNSNKKIYQAINDQDSPSSYCSATITRANSVVLGSTSAKNTRYISSAAGDRNSHSFCVASTGAKSKWIPTFFFKMFPGITATHSYPNLKIKKELN